MDPDDVEKSKRYQQHIDFSWLDRFAGGPATASENNNERSTAQKTRELSGEVEASVGPQTRDGSGDDDALCITAVNDPLIYPDIYAPSGFDMMRILLQVRNRPDPKIHLGAVDSSCALLLCDLASPDVPIVYCSDPFELLTGYASSEILGRNCRFLQSPSGIVLPGQRRQHTDDDKIWELKNLISAREEAQMQITNYKKGGEEFTNVLTTIPIRYDGPEFRYMVGFQVDLRTIFVGRGEGEGERERSR